MDIRRLPSALMRREFSLNPQQGHLILLEAGMVELLHSRRILEDRQVIWTPWDRAEVLRLEAGTRASILSLSRVELAAAAGTTNVGAILAALQERNLSASPNIAKWQRLSLLTDVIEEELSMPRLDSFQRLEAASSLILTSFLRLVRPDSSQGSAQLPLAERFMLLVSQHIQDQWGVNEYAQALGVTRFQLGDAVVRHCGCKPQAYLQNQWLAQAQALLRQPQLRVATVAYRLGFQEPAYFSRAFKQLTGQTPREWRVAVQARGENNFASWP